MMPTWTANNTVCHSHQACRTDMYSDCNVKVNKQKFDSAEGRQLLTYTRVMVHRAYIPCFSILPKASTTACPLSQPPFCTFKIVCVTHGETACLPHRSMKMPKQQQSRNRTSGSTTCNLGHGVSGTQCSVLLLSLCRLLLFTQHPRIDPSDPRIDPSDPVKKGQHALAEGVKIVLWCTSRILFHLSGSITAPGCLANSCTMLPGLFSLSELVLSQAGLEEVFCWSAPASMSLALLALSDAESRPDLSAPMESLVCTAPPDVHEGMVCRWETQVRFDDTYSQLRTDNSSALLASRHSS